LAEKAIRNEDTGAYGTVAQKNPPFQFPKLKQVLQMLKTKCQNCLVTQETLIKLHEQLMEPATLKLASSRFSKTGIDVSKPAGQYDLTSICVSVMGNASGSRVRCRFMGSFPLLQKF